MAKKPAQPSSAPAIKRPRGRPPKLGGRLPQVEIQRAYRARLKAAGKVVRLVDADPINSSPASSPVPTSMPDFDPATDGTYEQAMVVSMRDQLRNALLKLELREEDVARLQKRNAYLEGELRLQEQHLTNAQKDNILLKQKLATPAPQRRTRRALP